MTSRIAGTTVSHKIWSVSLTLEHGMMSQTSPEVDVDGAAMQRFVGHYRTAEAYCAYDLVHRSSDLSSAAPAVFPATLFGAACFLLSRLLQVRKESVPNSAHVLAPPTTYFEIRSTVLCQRWFVWDELMRLEHLAVLLRTTTKSTILLQSFGL